MPIPDMTPAPQEEPTKPKKKRGGKSLKDAIAAPPPRPSLDAFLDHFFAYAGGPQKVAKLLFEEFREAPAGSLMRQRVLESVLRNLKTADAQGDAQDNMGVLTDQDLDKLIDQKLAKLTNTETTPNGDSGPQQPGDPEPA